MGDTQNRIHTASMRMLGETGIALPGGKIQGLLRENGVRVENGRAFFSEGDLMHWVGKSPPSFKVYARNPNHDMDIGNGSREFAPGFGAPQIVDYNGNRRLATFKDYMNFVKMVQNCPLFKVNGGLLVQPSDLTQDGYFAAMLYAALVNSDKCLIGGAGGARESEIVMDMLKIAFGEADLCGKPRIFGIVNTSSPMGISGKSLETIEAFAKNKQPLIFTPGPICGMTGPVTLAGHLAMANAEALAAIAIAQMFNEGAPVVYGVQGSGSDMRTASPCPGSADSAKIVAHSARMAKFYNLPCRSGGAKNDAKAVDVQSGYESMMMLLTSCIEGIDLMVHSAGILDSILSMSYEKFVVDTEIIGMVKHWLEGIGTDEESLAVDVVKEGVAAGEFITSDHTLRNYKAAGFYPDISLRGVLPENETPGSAIARNIDAKIDELLKARGQGAAPLETRDSLLCYIRQAGINIDTGAVADAIAADL